MVVTISRELGAGGESVGGALAEALDAALLDERTILRELCARRRYTEDFVAETWDRPPTLGESLADALAASVVMLPGCTQLRMPQEHIIESVRELVFERAAAGNVVVVGHGGVSLLGWRPPGFRTLAILLQAGREWRIAQLARGLSVDIGEARRRIARTDDARARFQKHFFRSNMFDSRLYDLTLNTEILGLPLAIELARRTALATLADERKAPEAARA